MPDTIPIRLFLVEDRRHEDQGIRHVPALPRVGERLDPGIPARGYPLVAVELVIVPAAGDRARGQQDAPPARVYARPAPRLDQ